MKALVYFCHHQVWWEDWPDPNHGTGDVLVRVSAAGASELPQVEGINTDVINMPTIKPIKLDLIYDEAHKVGKTTKRAITMEPKSHCILLST